MMWLPALCAFVMAFTFAAQGVSLVLLAAVCGGAYLLRDRRAPAQWDAAETRQLYSLLWIALPLTVFSAYLQYTHVMRVAADGSWHVGQSTYGDLPMHLSFITGLKNAGFPPEYPFFPGKVLGYPFLTDSLSTSLYLLGMSLQLATILPAALMSGLCYAGVLLLARDQTSGRKAAMLAALLFFLNGGLGFLYDFDQAAGVGASGQLRVVERVRAILEGYYKTPTNQPEPNNLRWSNVIVDLMLPQRTLLGGWCMVLPCFSLLLDGMHGNERDGRRAELLLAVWAGLLPLVHTHSFLALALASFGLMVYDLMHGGGERQALLLRYLRYAVITALLALPQLGVFTFPQALARLLNPDAPATKGFLSLQFNWVNNPRGQGMRDFYFWFYIKNIGLPFLLMLASFFEKTPRFRRKAAALLPIVLAAETVRFQPNEYDNNKLLYLAWLFGSMLAADEAALLWRRLRGVRARGAMAAFAAVVIFLAPALTLWREAVSDYQAFDADAVACGVYLRDHTEEDVTVLSGTQHLNPASAIAGRKTVCGPDLWLYYHGIQTEKRKADIAAFFADPEANMDVIDRYGADIVLVSSYERSAYAVDEDVLDRLLTPLWSEGSFSLWQVKQ